PSWHRCRCPRPCPRARVSRLVGDYAPGPAWSRLPERMEAGRLILPFTNAGRDLVSLRQRPGPAAQGVQQMPNDAVISQARTPETPLGQPIDPGVRIGHVHLKVADIERSLAFYCGVLGFELTARYGTQAAFFSAGGYHHHFGINTWESKSGSPPPPGTTGL